MSLPRRVGVLVAGLGGLAGSTTIGLLWATEPGALPAGTKLVFAAMILVGVTWACFAGWALIRRPLFAVDRVITGWLAATFSFLTTGGTVAVAVNRTSTVGVLAAGGLGLILIVVSSTMLIRARAYRATLLARKRELEDHKP
ncbi:hypothetical protein [Micromonospora sp. CNB394]|nr:hypothetical protein [Micromonospora sp. CNB394]